MGVRTVMKRKVTWILIADGARARVLNYLGRQSGVEQLPGCDWLAPHAPDRELGSDRPGRAFDSVGKGRHAIDPHTNLHRSNKADFARQITNRLTQKLKAGAFERLVLIAPPKALGDIRNNLDQELSKCVYAQVPLDLTHVPNDEIGSYLKQHVPTL